MDRVGQALSSMDDRFGHICVNGDCNDVSTHQISYKCEDVSESDEESENNECCYYKYSNSRW